MKQFRIMLAAAAFIAAVGAFSTAKAVDPSETYVQTSPGNFQRLIDVQGLGSCQPGPTSCKYLKDDLGAYHAIDRDMQWIAD